MLNLTLRRGKRARVCRNDECEFVMPTDEPTALQLAPTGLKSIVHRRVSLEVAVPRGPMTSYGLLGLESRDGLARGDISVLVPVSESGPIMTDSFVPSDTVRYGLPREYLSAVEAGLSEGLRRFGTPNAEALRAHAAHAEVGSSRWIFERIATALVALQVHDLDETSVVRLLEDVLSD